jgi:adenine-specific DNA-methyltransferase
VGIHVKIASARELLVLAKTTARESKKQIGESPVRRLGLCLDLLAETSESTCVSEFAKYLSRLETNYRHYWIGTFYTLLLPPSVRKAHAAYFTPPHLAQAILHLVRNEGFDPLRHTAIDPAAGGAAFLSTLAGEMRAAGAKPADIRRRLRGIEIDRGLARLSEALIAARIGRPVPQASLVSVNDALHARISNTYDLVIANPPYGRIFPLEVSTKTWEQVCHPGHLNKYALFAELCFRLAKPGGLVALEPRGSGYREPPAAG